MADEAARPPRRILAVRTDARLGNLLLLTPSLRLLKAAFPDSELHLLFPRQYRSVLRFNPYIDRRLSSWSVPLLPFLKYDLAIDFSPHHAFSRTGAFWTAWSGAPLRVGFDRGQAARFVTRLVAPPSGQAHETANLALLVRAAAPRAALPPGEELLPEYHFGPDELEEGRRRWSEAGLDERSVALFVGGRKEKRLPADWFLELGKRLVSAGRRVALVAGPAEQGALGPGLPAGLSLLSGLDVRPFAAMLRNASALLTSDSGPMHLAVAIGVPTIAMFSHTETYRFGYGDRVGHSILETPGRHATVEEAFQALSRLLEKPRP